MAFNGTEAREISLNEASEWTSRYRNSQSPGTTLAHFFGREILLKILDQEGCMGIRCYYSLDEENKPQLILVGSDANENDMLQGVIAERSVPCPPFCGSDNVLNSN